MDLRARDFVSRNRQPLLLGGVLALSSLAALAARVFYSGTAGYLFMVWNLFLACLPLWLAVPIWALSFRERPAAVPLLALGFVCLLFFPNAPYLLTEFQHLHPHHAVSARPLGVLAGVSP